MRRDNPARHFLLAFVIALALYIIAYSWIEHRRYRKGPWEVTFTNSAGSPALIINQPALGLTNITLIFQERTNTSTSTASSSWNTGSHQATPLNFRAPRQTPFDVPFGQCVFEDLTFLPGTVTFQIFGHEIELLPRTLVIDQKEHPWKSEETIGLESIN